MAEEAKMLGETVCYCSSCKLELNHRITLMDGDEPSKVLCLTCNKEHKYRKHGPKKRATKKATTTATATQKAKARQTTEEKLWEEKLLSDVTPVKYNIKGEFGLDDHVMHPKFGKGLVIGFEYPDKTHIYFSEGVKILKGRQKGVG